MAHSKNLLLRDMLYCTLFVGLWDLGTIERRGLWRASAGGVWEGGEPPAKTNFNNFGQRGG